jgi:hypothetical protein
MLELLKPGRISICLPSGGQGLSIHTVDIDGMDHVIVTKGYLVAIR